MGLITQNSELRILATLSASKRKQERAVFKNQAVQERELDLDPQKSQLQVDAAKDKKIGRRKSLNRSGSTSFFDPDNPLILVPGVGVRSSRLQIDAGIKVKKSRRDEINRREILLDLNDPESGVVPGVGERDSILQIDAAKEIKIGRRKSLNRLGSTSFFNDPDNPLILVPGEDGRDSRLQIDAAKNKKQERKESIEDPQTLVDSTRFRNLKYSETRAIRDPAVIKNLPDKRRETGLFDELGAGLQSFISKRADDAERITRTLTRPEGIRFVANQALLNQNQAIRSLTALRPGEIDGGRAARGAARVLGVPASAIAQSAVSGTGSRLIQGGIPINGGYLSEGSTLRGFLSSFNPFSSGDSDISKSSQALRGGVINDSFVPSEYKGLSKDSNDIRKFGLENIEAAQKISLGGEDSTLLNSTYLRDTEGKGKLLQTLRSSKNNELTEKRKAGTLTFEQRTNPRKLSSRLDDIGVKSEYVIPEESNGVRDGGIDTEDGKTNIDRAKEKALKEKDKSERKKKFIPFKPDEKKYTKTPGHLLDGQEGLRERFFTINRATTDSPDEDKINVLDVKTTEIVNPAESIDQIIPFKFKVYPGNSEPELLYFRAYLEALGDNYSGTWSPTNYIGRADPVYTYENFSRGVSFSFKMATHSKTDLKPLYDKLNRLAGTTAPHYDGNGFFKQGVFIELTIGDYLKKVPGFFNSVDLTWAIQYPWETEDEGRKVPHILDINCSFQPIHNFNPQYRKDFIGPIEEPPLLANVSPATGTIEGETLT